MLRINAEQAEELHHRFTTARPFKHIIVDNFFPPDLAERLLEEFPSIKGRSVAGRLQTGASESTRQNIRSFGAAFTSVDNLLSSPTFLEFISKVTGISDLQFDPEYTGGGTHESLDGEELDIHIDSNYHRNLRQHRRLSLTVFLNKDWESSWGGELELHSNPRNQANNQVVSIAPLFNRCVLFETTEDSWHGLRRISLPEHKRQLTCKSLSLYFYTSTRPESEVVAPHNTFYVQPPLPPSIAVGTTLTAEQFDSINKAIRTRDIWIQFYQRLEISMSKELHDLRGVAKQETAETSVHIMGDIEQQGVVAGFYKDRWINNEFQITLRAARTVTALEFGVHVPEQTPSGHSARIWVNEQTLAEIAFTMNKQGTARVPCFIKAGETMKIRIEGDIFTPKNLGLNNDPREMTLNLEYILAEH